MTSQSGSLLEVSLPIGDMPISRRNRILDAILKTAFLSLHTSFPGEEGDGEISGRGYSRQPITFSLSESGQSRNTNTVQWRDMPATTISHIGIWDSKEGGVLWWRAELPQPEQFFERNIAEYGEGMIIVRIR